MPASFEEEALKAQTCAARTYTAVLQKSAGHKHPDADICADSTCCQAYIERADAQARWGLNAQSYSEKIARAVADTDGLGVTYGGEPIQALFFSSSPGRTVDAAAVWGSRVDYLTGVDSPEGEEVPNYHTQVDKTAQEVHRAVLDAYPGADLSGANLSRANLFGADYIEKAKNLFYPIACPEIGAFVGWKKARVKTSGHECIVKLEITEDAVRSSAAGRKCRCSKATVLEIQDLEGIVLEQVAVSDRDENFHYIPGTVVSVSDFDENRWNECSTGIHFYITREEAVRHIL